MSARPIDTFASEGWARPHRARSEHYFRLSATEQSMGPDAVYSLCGVYGDGGVGRPRLKVFPISQKCRRCSTLLTEQLERTDGGWFERKAADSGTGGDS